MSAGNKSARGTIGVPRRPHQNRGIKALRRALAPEKRGSLRKATADGFLCAGNREAPNFHEESFQLHPCPCTAKPFAMVIRLQPETLEELKQATSEGQETMMKFGAHVSGHEIKVGAETFKFSSASEPGDLCDIYEQKSGENMLIEAASVWRKLCVQRILSATEKDRVKKRTAEAEKLQRLRKSILVDPTIQTIPSTGIQESNKKLMARVTKAPLAKKHKIMGSTSFKNSTRLANDCPFELTSIPEILSPTEKVDGPMMFPMIEKEALPVEAKSQISAGKDIGGNGSGANMIKLRNFLISFLQENPKGATIKEVEKAVVDGLLGSMDRKIIAKVIKSIAIYLAPGRYFLKPAIHKESSGVNSVKNQQGTAHITVANVSSAVAIPRKASIIGKEESLCLQEKLEPSTETQDLYCSSSKEVVNEQIKLLVECKRNHRENLSACNIDYKSKAVNTDNCGSSSYSQSDSRDNNSPDTETHNDIDYNSIRISGSTDEEIDILSDNIAMKKSETDCEREVNGAVGGQITGVNRNSDSLRKRMVTGISLLQHYRSGHVSDSARNGTAETVGKHGCMLLASHKKGNTSQHGPIQSIEEYHKYYWEFKEKYPTYHQLYVDIETFKRKFQVFKNDIHYAKHKDDGSSFRVCGEVRKNYMMERKRCKHMYNVFEVLHKELNSIKYRCKEYVEKTAIG